MLVLFALVARSRRALLSVSGSCACSFADLAHQHGAYYEQASSPNDPRFVEWIRSNGTDILLMMASFVLKKPIIEAPRLGCINKHAAALPCNRGLFPYFWARLHGTAQGVSYHEVTPAIDEGPLLYQRTDFREEHLKSMVSFYLEVFSRFPEDIVRAVRARVDGSRAEPRTGLAPSYFGLPTRADYRRFRAAGGQVARLADLKGALHLC
jgi:methionyl-tRNA formyltransferase